MTSEGASSQYRLRRFELASMRGIWLRQLALFRRNWTSWTFASLVEPAVYLLAFGFGFGSMIAVVGGYKYVYFVATGVVGTSALFTSIYPGMLQTYVQRQFQRTYDGILAAPVDVHELVTAEAIWIAVKSAVYSFSPIIIAIALGLRPEPSVVLIPIITLVTASGFGLFGIWISTMVPSSNSFDYFITGLVTPLFLVAGTFFPISALPGWARMIAQLNPLYHCVQLVREAVFGIAGIAGFGHAGALILFTAISWVLAVRGMRRKLID